MAVVALLVYEHSLVRPGDLSRLDMAFFNVNGYIAVIVLVAVVTGLWREMTKAEAVRAMFTRIAGRYDLMNSVMTGGRHHAWRRVAAARRRAGAPAGPALDLATGTGDLAFAVRAAASAALRGRRRLLRGHAAPRDRASWPARGERGVALLAADALALPFARSRRSPA